MTESNRGRIRDTTVPVLLGTLIVALFCTIASTHGRMADMETGLGDQISALSDRITRLETLMEIHLEAHSTQAASGGVRQAPRRALHFVGLRPAVASATSSS